MVYSTHKRDAYVTPDVRKPCILTTQKSLYFVLRHTRGPTQASFSNVLHKVSVYVRDSNLGSKHHYLLPRFLGVQEPPQREQELQRYLRVPRLVRPQVVQGAEEIAGRRLV